MKQLNIQYLAELLYQKYKIIFEVNEYDRTTLYWAHNTLTSTLVIELNLLGIIVLFNNTPDEENDKTTYYNAETFNNYTEIIDEFRNILPKQYWLADWRQAQIDSVLDEKPISKTDI